MLEVLDEVHGFQFKCEDMDWCRRMRIPFFRLLVYSATGSTWMPPACPLESHVSLLPGMLLSLEDATRIAGFRKPDRINLFRASFSFVVW